MVLLTFNSFTLTPLSSPLPSPSSSSSASVLVAVSRLQVKPIDLGPKSSGAVRISTPFWEKKRGLVIVRADADGGVGGATSGEEGGSPLPSSEQESSVEKLPSGSKTKERQLLRLRMKQARKIRKRRKRLFRKLKLRKRGIPPSKIDKLKNV